MRRPGWARDDPHVDYRSPFRGIDEEHDSVEPLCLSRTHTNEPTKETLKEFYGAAVATIEAGMAQPAFFLVRQFAELGVKALYGPAYLDRSDLRRCHSITKFLDALRERNDELLGAGEEQRLVVQFLRDVDSRDPGGDQGRFANQVDGTPSLASVCCADPEVLRDHLDRLMYYLAIRLDL